MMDIKRTKYCSCGRQLPTRSGKNKSGLCYVCSKKEYDKIRWENKKENEGDNKE